LQTEKTTTTTGNTLSAPERWLEYYGDDLFSYAMRRLHNNVQAEDAVQDTLLSALQSVTGFRGKASEKTWLTSILKNKIIDIYRKQTREVMSEEIDVLADAHIENDSVLFDARGNWVSPPQYWGDPYTCANNAQFLEIFQQCFSRLPLALSRAFSMRVISGSSAQDICNDLAITPTYVNVLLFRARMKLRRCIELKQGDATER